MPVLKVLGLGLGLGGSDAAVGGGIRVSNEFQKQLCNPP